ncbi:MAG: hypothetical protein ABJP48_09755 [Erythrobacter sp.]
MHKFLTRAASLLTLLLLAAPASAAWEDTVWGATPDATLAVLGETAKLIEENEGQRVWDQHFLIAREGSFHDIAVTQEFFFEDGERLSVIKIKPQNTAECGQFSDIVMDLLGEVQDTRQSEIGSVLFIARDFSDRESDNAMMLSSIDSDLETMQFCHLTYQPFGDGIPGERK